MGISSLFKRLVLWMWPVAAEVDQRLLDGWIHDALQDEAAAQPPSGAWEKLCKVIIERRPVKYGMWVLDEPFRDPPASHKAMWTYQDSQHVLRGEYRLRFTVIHESIWGNLPSTFGTLGNW